MLAKILILLITCCIIDCGVIGTEDSNVEGDSAHHKLKHFFIKRCKDSGNTDKVDEILSQETIKICISKQFDHYSFEDHEGIKQQCFDDSKEVIECFRNFMDWIFPCLPAGEDWVPDFLIEMYEGYSKYLCEHIETLTFSGMLRTNMSKCLNEFVRHPEENPNNICFKEALGNYHESEIITKKDVCKVLDLAYTCYEHQYKKHCSYAPEAWEFQSGLLHGVESPCEENNDDEQQ